MNKGDFRFKEFQIQQSDCAQKVCTEACVMGAFVAQNIQAKKVLDIGSGTGLLSLMYAQKNSAQIIGVEIHTPCYLQALHNLEKTHFEHDISFVNEDIKNYDGSKNFDLIISNPPFHTASLLSSNRERAMAKHDTTLKATDWVSIIHHNAAPHARIALLLSNTAIGDKYDESIRSTGFTLKNRIEIKDKSHTPAGTLVLIYDRTEGTVENYQIVIKKEDGSYTSMMKMLLKDYYLYL